VLSFFSGRRVYVGSLPFSATSDSLRDYFEKFGSIESADVVMDRDDPSRSRGFGFVTFMDSATADEAVKNMDGADMDGRSVSISRKNTVNADDWPLNYTF
jgi:RNA recognition motif-containing protein